MDILEIYFHPQFPFEVQHFSSHVTAAVDVLEKVTNFISAAESLFNFSLHRQAQEVVRCVAEGIFGYPT